MSTTSIYLNFQNNCQEAFEFYKSVFGTEYIGEVSRYGEMPQEAGMPEISDQIKNLVLNVQLPILGGVKLMGSDTPEGISPIPYVRGTNFNITLETDTREETDYYFKKLAEGGSVDMPLGDTFWNAYYGACTDRFGIQWSFNCEYQK